MTIDLYAQLGLSKTANKQQIRRAYRDKAKSVHPDAGGSQEQFGALKLAHDILTDDVRRHHYDETGEVKEKPVDNHDAEIRSFISSLIDHVFQTLLKNNQLNVLTQMDFLEKCKERALALKDENAKAQHNLVIGIQQNERLLGRFIRRQKADEPNILEDLVRGRIKLLQEHQQKLIAMVKLIDEGRAVLDQYSFRQDQAQMVCIIGFGGTSTGTWGSI